MEGGDGEREEEVSVVGVRRGGVGYCGVGVGTRLVLGI